MRTHSLLKWCALFACVAFWPAGRLEAETKSTPPDNLLRQAVQSELAGATAPRTALLADALDHSPGAAALHWHAGQVRWNGQWLSADEVASRAADDEHLAEYRELRNHSQDSLDNHRDLAHWCSKHDLSEEARVHWVKVLEAAPADREAAKALDLRRFRGRMLTGDEVTAWKDSQGDQHRTRREWRPKMAAWRSAIERGSPQARLAALAELREFDDPTGITALEGVFGANGTTEKSIRSNLLLVETLARLPGREATQALARQAVLNNTIQGAAPRSRNCAARPLHTFVPQLIAAAPGAFATRYQLATADLGGLAFAHRLLSEGNDTTVVRRATIRDNAVLFDVVDGPAGTMPTGSQNPQLNDAALHERIRTVLANATPLANLDNPANWERSWYQYNSWDPPQYRQEIRNLSAHSCFPAGTLVPTLAGPLPIEQIKIGDRVLSMDERTGELDYKAVQRPTRRGMTADRLDPLHRRIAARHPRPSLLGRRQRLASRQTPGARRSPGRRRRLSARRVGRRRRVRAGVQPGRQRLPHLLRRRTAPVGARQLPAPRRSSIVPGLVANVSRGAR